MPKNTLATLSTLNFSSNPQETAKKLIEYYNESNQSQSTVFYGSLRSLAYAIHRYGTSPSELAATIKSDLEYLFGQYFDDINFTINVDNLDNGTFNLKISGRYSSDGKSYTLSEEYTKSPISKISW